MITVNLLGIKRTFTGRDTALQWLGEALDLVASDDHEITITAGLSNNDEASERFDPVAPLMGFKDPREAWNAFLDLLGVFGPPKPKDRA